MEDRPGVPMEHRPQPLTTTAHWQEPERQPEVRGLTRRRELQRLTPVFSEACPPRGLSGAIKRIAYNLPEAHARHWMLLLMSDRVELLEHRIARLVKLVAVVPMAVAGVVIAAKMVRART